MTNALDCYDKDNIRNRVNDAIVADANPVCVSSVHEFATTGGTRILGQLPNRANDTLSCR